MQSININTYIHIVDIEEEAVVVLWGGGGRGEGGRKIVWYIFIFREGHVALTHIFFSILDWRHNKQNGASWDFSPSGAGYDCDCSG